MMPGESTAMTPGESTMPNPRGASAADAAGITVLASEMLVAS